ncbi:MAG: ComEC/Rec2 family competence protein [Candidatus Krumholzibacteriia bacterium]
MWYAHRCISPRPLLALALAGTLSGCASKEAITDPPPPVQNGVRVAGRVVQWSTDVATRGSVRFGLTRGEFDHMAYPVAAGRRDRQLRTDHEVPLLDLRAGQRVYFQTVSEAPGAPPAISGLDSFTASTSGPNNILTSTMIHIGFGDSHLITFPNGRHVLIDGGERQAATAVEEYLAEQNVNSIDAMLATHVHIDHIGGLVGEFGISNDGVLASRPPILFFDSPQKTFLRSAYDEALQTASSHGVDTRILTRGQTSDEVPELDWDPQVRVTVLASGTPPNYTLSGHEGTDINNDSIVLRFSFGDVDFVIGGDAEDFSEASMLEFFDASELDVEYYKAHHHGLPDASSSNWVATLRPRVAFVPNTQQVWNGSLKDAIAESSSRFETIGAHVYVVDEARSLDRFRGDGRQYNVTFTTDGRSYEVRVEVATQTAPSKSAALAACIAHDEDLQALGLVTALAAGP